MEVYGKYIPNEDGIETPWYEKRNDPNIVTYPTDIDDNAISDDEPIIKFFEGILLLT